MTIEKVRFVSFHFQNDLLEKRLSSLEQDFRLKFKYVDALVVRFEKNLEETISHLNPNEISRRLSLLEEQSLLREYKESLAEVDEAVQASEEAADWLKAHRGDLIFYAREHLFNADFNELKKISGIPISKRTLQLLCRDLDFYLQWIASYLRMLKPPDNMPSGIIQLVLPIDVYLDAFKLMSARVKVEPSLSGGGTEMLRSSIYRFLIKRDLSQDTSV